MTAGPGGPAVRVVVWLRPWSTGSVVVVSAEHRLDLPLAVHRLRVELVSPRDRLLGCGGGRRATRSLPW
ncbi:hypothetical protein [Herbidospora cretacea]|uniref:hypothetical protein n=1 Tax=Herbidospora cretacea TaxID=28444 RepID=UPI001470D1F1|nr:hypothetical protein [Herbidospora cretacea]